MDTHPSQVAALNVDDLQLSDLRVEELTPEEVSKLRSSTTVGTGSSVNLFQEGGGSCSCSGSSVFF